LRPGAFLLIGGLALTLGAGLAFGLREVARARCFVLTGSNVCRVETQVPLVALTFDDGPTELGLDAVLPVLERHGVRATFFLTGREVAHRPDLARRLVAAGHELGNHSFSHDAMVFRSSGFYDREIAETERLLAAAGGGSGLFRPPYGKKLAGLPLAVERAGLTMVTWNVEDPVTSDPIAFARQIVERARPGSIILIHPMNPANATARAALPLVLDGLAARGLKAVTVGELRAAGARAPTPRRRAQGLNRLPSPAA
jgi:peptidoglycan/xylan/chitin deacetylase (PgdA/CDA1 family)